jgi:predicted ATPase
MHNVTNRLFIITGGPGAGKSTLIDALAREGHATVPESGREIIREQTVSSGRALPSLDPRPFARSMFERDLQRYLAHRDSGSIESVYFDRGLADTTGYEAHRITGRADHAR